MTIQEALFLGPCMYWKHTGSLPQKGVAQLASQLWMSFKQDLNRANTALAKQFHVQPISTRYITIPAKNMANDIAFGLCLAGVGRPVKKESLNSFGKNEGFRIAKDIDLNPESRSGLCVGMCLEFLSAYFSAKGSEEAQMLAAANLFRNGAPPQALSSQLIYDALMPEVLPQAELSEWQKLLGDPGYKPQVSMNSEKESLLKILQTYFEVVKKHPEESLRKFVFKDLKPISPEVYAIVLHLDSVVFAQTKKVPLSQVHTQYDCDIKQTLLSQQGLQIDKSKIEYVASPQATAIQTCQALAPGTYLLIMPLHDVVFVKTNNGKSALFDPLSGTAIMDPAQEKEVFAHLLQFYFSNQAAHFPIIPIKK